MFVDTHVHLTEKVYKDLISELLSEAEAVGVKIVISVGTSLNDSNGAIAIAKQNKFVFSSVGMHPCDVTPSWQKDFSEIELLIKEKNKNKIVALGETGLDFFHKPYDQKLQTDLFIAHIDCSIKYDLPLIIHIRESADDVLKILQQFRGKVRGVAHCFMQTEEIARKLISWGFYLGIGGPITYPKNEWYRELIKNIPLKNLLLETDAPYLPPQEYRGKTNYPKYIPLIAKTIAEVKKIEIAAVEESTTANAKLLFSI